MKQKKIQLKFQISSKVKVLLSLLKINKYVILTYFSFGCNDPNVRKQSYDVKYYRHSDIIYKKTFNKNSYDSLVYYYKNGKVYKTGNIDKNGQMFGNWNYHTIDGRLSQTGEYFVINRKSFSNRFWFFNDKGDTIDYATKFNRFDQKEFAKDTIGNRASTLIDFLVYTKDTILLGEPFLASVICNSPVGNQYKSEIMMLIAKEDYNFNKDFSNTESVKLDTFYNLTKDVDNRQNFYLGNNPERGYRYIAAFGRWFKTPGRKVIRGYMREYYRDDHKFHREKYAYTERRVYFEKEIIVKDTVK